MKMKIFPISVFVLLGLLISCGSGPKEIEGQPIQDDISPNSIPSLGNQAAPSTPDGTIRKVVLEEVLTTDKYNYMQVSEDEQKYWIAISKADVEVGETYYFRGGLLKRNFFSREFNRVFDTVYLVSEIWSKKSKGQAVTPSEAADEAQMPELEVGELDVASGGITLAELFANKEKYQNQVVSVTGKVVKVNPQIMNRNWLHIQDGSGKDLDLTITTDANVPLGAVVTMEGTITLDKDFGAGYRYDIIMESATVVGGSSPANMN